MYWDINETKSYNALFNFIVGTRGCGKSYGCKVDAINDFIKNGNQFVWVRRYDSELDDFKTLFFSDIMELYPNDIMEYTGYKFYINGVVMGYAIPLSISMKKKSSSYHNVNKIIFDEFIIDKGNNHYIKNEVQLFLDLCETIMRMRDIKYVMLIANAITFTNPYFLKFNVQPPTNKKLIKKTGDLLIQYAQNVEFIEAKKKTRFGRFIAGTEFAEYSIENKFLRDNDDFIKKPSGNSRYLFTLKGGGLKFGVYHFLDDNMIYVTKNYDATFRIVYTTLLDNHEPNTLLLKGLNGSPLFKIFIEGFKTGLVYFDCIQTKNIALESLKHML